MSDPKKSVQTVGSAPAQASPPLALAPWIEEQLTTLSQRSGHAWLLHGPSGLGQYTLSLELARAWLCLSPVSHKACGNCSSCHLIDVKAHPDLLILMPEVQMLELEWPLSEKAQKEIDDKDRKPSKEIRVEAVREMVEFSQRTSSGLNPKIVLIYPAEKLNIFAANTLLKTLEEPPGDSRFIVASEAAHLLLPTIRSRCQSHTMMWPEQSFAIQWLMQEGLDENTASTLLKASGGRPEDALNFAAIGVDAQLWNQIPRSLAKADSSVLESFSPKEVISIMQKVCTDLIANYFQSETRYFSPGVLPKAQNIQALTQWFKDLSLAAKTSEHPYNAGLKLESLTVQASKALQS